MANPCFARNVWRHRDLIVLDKVHMESHKTSLSTLTVTVDPLCIDCWLLTLCTLTVDPLCVDCWPLYIDCRPSLHWLLTLSALTVDLPPPQDQQSTVLIVNHLTVDHWPSHCWLSIPPRINSQQCWLLIASLLTIDPLTVGCRSSPPTDSNFVIFNILMYVCVCVWTQMNGRYYAQNPNVPHFI